MRVSQVGCEKKSGFCKGAFPEAEKYYSEAISIPLFSQMTDEDIEKVIDVLKSTINCIT